MPQPESSSVKDASVSKDQFVHFDFIVVRICTSETLDNRQIAGIEAHVYQM